MPSAGMHPTDSPAVLASAGESGFIKRLLNKIRREIVANSQVLLQILFDLKRTFTRKEVLFQPHRVDRIFFCRFDGLIADRYQCNE